MKKGVLYVYCNLYIRSGDPHCALSYGIRIYNDTRFAEQMDLTLSKREILEFLNLLARNTAQPEELHDLAEDFLASL